MTDDKTILACFLDHDVSDESWSTRDFFISMVVTPKYFFEKKCRPLNEEELIDDFTELFKVATEGDLACYIDDIELGMLDPHDAGDYSQLASYLEWMESSGYTVICDDERFNKIVNERFEGNLIDVASVI